MGAQTELRRRTHRVGVGIVEVVPEPREASSLRAIRANLSDRVCALLTAIVVAAQVADVVTTFHALGHHVYVEDNPLLRALIDRSPVAAYTVKLLVVTAMVVLILSRLHGRRAKGALAFAATLSLIAPVLNFLLIQGS